MSNVMSLKGLKNHVHRNGFDLSARNLFTAKVGELLPVMTREVLPGDKFKIKQQWFTRTVPVKSPAFTRIREYYDYFFVPCRILWKNFDNFITDTQTPQFAVSQIGSASNPTTLPYCTYEDVINLLRGVRDINNNNGNINVVGAERWLQSMKLLNYLGYGDFSQFVKADKSTDDVTAYNQMLNLLPLFAYQKIYQDFFRNSQWEHQRPYLCNLDYITGSNTYCDLSNYYKLLGFYDTPFDLRYCDWQKDMFMGVLPNAQYGDVSTVVSDSFGNLTNNGNTTFNDPYAQLHTSITSSGSNYVQGVGSSQKSKRLGISDGNSVMHYIDKFTGSGIYIEDVQLQSKFSVLALRQAEALQRRNEITQANRTDYVHQTRAHWNVEVPDVRGNLSTYIGGHVGNISVNEVVNTSLTQSETSDAFIQGKGVGSGDGSLSFEAKEHGIIMCIYHALPLLEWSSFGVKPLNCKIYNSQFAIPEFDNLGMEEVPAVYLSNSPVVQEFIANQKSLGYAPRYFDYKTCVDESHGAFMSSLSDWTANVTEEYLSSQLFEASALSSGITYAFFKCNAAILYNIFGVNPWVDGGSVDTDQLRINSFFDVKVARNLDYNGLPY